MCWAGCTAFQIARTLYQQVSQHLTRICSLVLTIKNSRGRRHEVKIYECRFRKNFNSLLFFLLGFVTSRWEGRKKLQLLPYTQLLSFRCPHSMFDLKVGQTLTSFLTFIYILQKPCLLHTMHSNYTQKATKIRQISLCLRLGAVHKLCRLGRGAGALCVEIGFHADIS